MEVEVDGERAWIPNLASILESLAHILRWRPSATCGNPAARIATVIMLQFNGYLPMPAALLPYRPP